MRYHTKKIVETVCCLIVLFTAHAQKDALAAIQAINNAYNSGITLSFRGSLKMYNKAHPEKLMEKMQSTYVLKGGNFMCSIGPVEMLLNDSYYVSVDKAIKLVIIGYRTDLSGTSQMPVLNTAQFKQWITANTIQASVTSGSRSAVLQLRDTPASTGYKLYKIKYDVVSGFMKEVLLETSDNNDVTNKTVVLEINYSTPVKMIEDESTFSEKKFFSVVNKKVLLTSNYKGYQLINQL
jgi:hypothetical protein